MTTNKARRPGQGAAPESNNNRENQSTGTTSLKIGRVEIPHDIARIAVVGLLIVLGIMAVRSNVDIRLPLSSSEGGGATVGVKTEE